MLNFLVALRRDERGVSALEYAILAAVVLTAMVGLGTTFGTELTNLFGALTSKLQGATTGLGT